MYGSLKTFLTRRRCHKGEGAHPLGVASFKHKVYKHIFSQHKKVIYENSGRIKLWKQIKNYIGKVVVMGAGKRTFWFKNAKMCASSLYCLFLVFRCLMLSLDMLFKIAFSFESFLTNRALKWLRIAVNKLVFLELITQLEWFGAGCTFVRSNASVH